MKYQTLFLKAAVCVAGVGALAGCVGTLPWLVERITQTRPEDVIMYAPVFVVYATVVPFCVGLYHAFGLFTRIGRGQAFSAQSVRALRNIRLCASVISSLYVLGLPLFYRTADVDDAPGIMVIGLSLTGAALFVAVFTFVLKKLFEGAAERVR